ncbi:hypothetical protein [Nonomuraea rubra]|uniref:Uncharacterized protein n=1 Tax=Nonomuraea rubra TaxID=46180 RepID=A0A7X0TXC1_9ACTN|nr:hypothetical protein [Nonomuraea rubra]MBB6547034.1 hypothetical protein [Nonomuraea rubra]
MIALRAITIADLAMVRSGEIVDAKDAYEQVVAQVGLEPGIWGCSCRSSTVR